MWPEPMGSVRPDERIEPPLSRLELGAQGPPADEVIERIAAALKTKPEKLLRACPACRSTGYGTCSSPRRGGLLSLALRAPGGQRADQKGGVLTGTAGSTDESCLSSRVAEARRTNGFSEVKALLAWRNAPQIVEACSEWITLHHANGLRSRVGRKPPRGPQARASCEGKPSQIQVSLLASPQAGCRGGQRKDGRFFDYLPRSVMSGAAGRNVTVATRTAVSTAMYPVGKVLSVLLLVVAVTTLSAGNASAGNGSQRVGVHGEVSGSTLVINVSAAAGSRCATRLGNGADAKRLPRMVIGQNGRAKRDWSIPSDTQVGDHRLLVNCAHSGSRDTASAVVSIPQSAVSGVLAIVLNVLLDILLGGSLLLFLVLLVQMVVQEPNPGERMMRALALVCGALLALGAQAAEVGIASYTVETLTGTRPGGEFFKAMSAMVPGGIAVAMGWYFVRAMRRSTQMALRLVSFLGMLTVVTFIVIFAEATNTQGVFLGAAAIPNASFVIGLIGSVIIFNTPADAPKGFDRLAPLGDLLRRRRGSKDGAEAAPEPQARRNPFSEE